MTSPASWSAISNPTCHPRWHTRCTNLTVFLGSIRRGRRFIQMKPKNLCVLIALLLSVPAHAQRVSSPVPPGWISELADPETRTRRFVSPSGRAWLQTRQTFADRSALDRDMDDIAYRDGEQITYQRRGRTWIAVSGYWGDQIFYRKSNLACGGSVWHHIEFGYPRQDKKIMDAAVARMAHGMTNYSNDCPSIRR